jgi:hypothetical protein
MKILTIAIVSVFVLSSCCRLEKKQDLSYTCATEEASITIPESNIEIAENDLILGNDDIFTGGEMIYSKNGEVLAKVDFEDSDYATLEKDGETDYINLKKEDKESGYKKVIVKPLVKSDDCGYIISGVIKYYELETGDWSATVDFGDGTCDDIAEKETVKGNSTFKVSDYYK